MAQKTKKKSNDYTSLLDFYGRKNSINTASEADEEVSDIVDNEGEVNNIADVLKREQGPLFSRPNGNDEPGVAGFGNTANPARSSISNRNGGGSLDGLGKPIIPRPPLDVRQINASPAYDVPESSLPSFARGERSYPRATPMLGGINNIPPIRELLSNSEEQPLDSRYNDIVTRVTGTARGASPEYAQGSPEAKLAAAMANTNPAPRSMWKRLGASLLRGASQVQPGDAPETMLGKLIGNVIPGLVPSVDSKVQYEENLAKAEKQYARETAMEKNKQARVKADQDIKESNARIALQEQNNRILNQTRLDTVTKQRADQIMTALSKLPEDDAQRDALAKVLAGAPYNIQVGRNYGLLAKEEKEATQAAKTEAQSNKPLTEADLKRRAEATVKASYNWEEKARASTDARLDQIKANIRDTEFKGNVSSARREEYNKRVQAEYNRILQSNKDYSKAEYDRLLKAEMDRLRGTEASQATNKQASPGRSRGRARVPQSNAAKATDYRGVTITLPGVARKQ